MAARERQGQVKLKGMFKQGCDRDTLALKAYLEEA